MIGRWQRQGSDGCCGLTSNADWGFAIFRVGQALSRTSEKTVEIEIRRSSLQRPWYCNPTLGLCIALVS